MYIYIHTYLYLYARLCVCVCVCVCVRAANWTVKDVETMLSQVTIGVCVPVAFKSLYPIYHTLPTLS